MAGVALGPSFGLHRVAMHFFQGCLSNDNNLDQALSLAGTPGFLAFPINLLSFSGEEDGQFQVSDPTEADEAYDICREIEDPAGEVRLHTLPVSP